MPSGDAVLTTWWESSVPAFERAEDALVELGEGLVEYDAGRLRRTDADDLWAMSEIALANVSGKMAIKPEVFDPRSTLINSLLKEYGQGIDYFTVAYEAWRAGDDTKMDHAWQLAVESFDRATDHAASLARAARTAGQPRLSAEPDDAWRYARIAGPGDRQCGLNNYCAYVDGHPGACLDASGAAEMAKINETLKRAERAVGLSTAAQRGCLLPTALVAVGIVAVLLK